MLLEGQDGEVFTVVPVLEEEGKEEDDEDEEEEVGHCTGVDLVGVETRDSAEDLAEGDFEARGDFA